MFAEGWKLVSDCAEAGAGVEVVTSSLMSEDLVESYRKEGWNAHLARIGKFAM